MVELHWEGSAPAACARGTGTGTGICDLLPQKSGCFRWSIYFFFFFLLLILVLWFRQHNTCAGLFFVYLQCISSVFPVYFQCISSVFQLLSCSCRYLDIWGRRGHGDSIGEELTSVHPTALYCNIMCSPVPFCSVLHCSTLYCTFVHCNALLCTSVVSRKYYKSTN